MRVDIVSYKPSDQSAFKELVLNGFKEFGFSYMKECDSDLDDPSIYTDNGGATFLIKQDQRVIGSIAIINHKNGTAELKRFYIDQEFQNRGLGSLLLGKAIEFCKQNNFKKVELETNKKFEKAHDFYLKRDFKIFKEDERSFYMAKDL